MEMNEEAQIHTLEGFFASSIIIFTVLMITKASVIITPQSELAMDVSLKQTAYDALAVLDVAPETAFQSNLTELVAGWDMSEATPLINNLSALNHEIETQLNGSMYNIDFAYEKNGSFTLTHAIINGPPIENSIVVTRIVSLYNSTVSEANGLWNLSPDEVKVVEVRLIVWRV
jgi:hypothetical protein